MEPLQSRVALDAFVRPVQVSESRAAGPGDGAACWEIRVLNLLKTIWRSWKKAVHGLNAAISFTLMALVYWFALLPVAVGFRLFKRDALDRGPGDATALTAWTPIRSPREDIRRAQRPW